MADEPVIPPNTPADSDINSQVQEEPIKPEKINAKGLATKRTPPRIKKALSEEDGDLESLNTQAASVNRLLRLPSTSIPSFAANLYQKHQFDFSKIGKKQSRDPVAPGERSGDMSSLRLQSIQTGATLGLYQLHRSVGLTYMRKSLTLKYHQTALLKLLNASLGSIGQMLESKLEAIKLNTAAPDKKKTTLVETLKEMLKKEATKFVLDKIQKKAKAVLLTPLQEQFKNVINRKTRLSDLANGAKSTLLSPFTKVAGVFGKKPVIPETLTTTGEHPGTFRISTPFEERMDRLQTFLIDKFGPAEHPLGVDGGIKPEGVSGEGGLKSSPLGEAVPWWVKFEESQKKTHAYLEKIIALIPRAGGGTPDPTQSRREEDNRPPVETRGAEQPLADVTPARKRTSFKLRDRFRGIGVAAQKQALQGTQTAVTGAHLAKDGIYRLVDKAPGRIADAYSAGADTIQTVQEQVQARTKPVLDRLSETLERTTARKAAPHASEVVQEHIAKIAETTPEAKVIRPNFGKPKESVAETSEIQDTVARPVRRRVFFSRKPTVKADDVVGVAAGVEPIAEAVVGRRGRVQRVRDHLRDGLDAAKQTTDTLRAETIGPGIQAAKDRIRDKLERDVEVREASGPRAQPRVYKDPSAGYGFSLSDIVGAAQTTFGAGKTAYDILRGRSKLDDKVGKKTGFVVKGIRKVGRGVGVVGKTGLKLGFRGAKYTGRKAAIGALKTPGIVLTGTGKGLGLVGRLTGRVAKKHILNKRIKARHLVKAAKFGVKHTGTIASIAARSAFAPTTTAVKIIGGAARIAAPKLTAGAADLVKGSRTGRNILLLGKLAGGVERASIAGVAGSLLGTATDSLTEKGSLGNRLGHTAASAAEYAALGSFFGPVGTAVGAGVGVLVANFDLISSSMRGLSHVFSKVGSGLAGTGRVDKDGNPVIDPNKGLFGDVTKSVFGYDTKRDANGNLIYTKSSLLGGLGKGFTLGNDNTPAAASIPGLGIPKAQGIGSPLPFASNNNSPIASGVGGLIKASLPTPVDKRQIADQPEYKQVLSKLSPAVQAEVGKSKALQFVVWSTVLQHGPEAAIKIIETNYADGEDDKTYIRKIYQARTTKFIDASTGDRNKAFDQLGKERNLANGILDGSVQPSFAEASAANNHYIAPAGDATIPTPGRRGDVGINQNPTVGRTPSPQSGDVKTREKIAVDFFVNKGWTPAQAAGIVGGLVQESKLDANVKPGDSGLALGIEQWHPDRQKAIEQAFGKPVSAMNLTEQLAAVNWELTKGGEKRAGNMLRKAQTPAQAGDTVSRFYARPRNVESEASNRAALAVQVASYTGGSSGTPSLQSAVDKLGGASGPGPKLISAVDITPVPDDAIGKAASSQTAVNGATTRPVVASVPPPNDAAPAADTSSVNTSPSLLTVPKPTSSGTGDSIVSIGSKLNTGLPHSSYSTTEQIAANGGAVAISDLSANIGTMVSNQNSAFTKMIDHLKAVVDNTGHLGPTKDLLAKNLNKPNSVVQSSTQVTTTPPAANMDINLNKMPISGMAI